MITGVESKKQTRFDNFKYKEENVHPLKKF